MLACSLKSLIDASENASDDQKRIPAVIEEISTTGCLISHVPFIHFGSVVRIALVYLDGSAAWAKGTLSNCSYRGDGEHISEVEFSETVALERVIDRKQWSPTMLRDQHRAMSGKVLHAAGQVTAGLMEIVLSGTKASVTEVDSIEAFTRQLAEESYVAVVIDEELLGAPAAESLEEVVGLEYCHVVGVLAESGRVRFDREPLIAGHLIELEPTSTAEQMLGLMDSAINEANERMEAMSCVLPRPTAATLKSLDRCAASCAEIVNALRAGIVEDDATAAEEALAKLMRLASPFGFPSVGSKAERALKALRASCSITESRDDVCEAFRAGALIPGVIREIPGRTEATEATGTADAA